MAIDLSKGHAWGVATCNDPKVGYSQTYRMGKTVDGITYYDCSSFVWFCLKEAGFDVIGAYNKAVQDYYGNAITTPYLKAWLLELGWKQIDIKGTWKAGDIVWRDGHTEMVYSGGEGKGVTMGAHTSKVALADEVCINDFTGTYKNWSRLFRYTGSSLVVPSWIKGNRYLSQTEMENNAIIVYAYLTKRGWSFNAICGLLGNMQSESTINPAIWQNLKYGNYSGGYGLVQWTPATNYTNWAKGNDYDIKNGNYQLKWIDERTVTYGQWIKTDAYPISFDEFKKSEESVEYLASAFLKNFERAGVEVEQNRRSQALAWKTYLEEKIGDLDVDSGVWTPSGGLARRRKSGGFKFFGSSRVM